MTGWLIQSVGIIVWLALIGFILWMMYRFVRAVERIADKVEYVCPPRQENLK